MPETVIQKAILRSISVSAAKSFTTVIKLGGARIGVIRHILRRFERAAVAKEDRYACASKCVIAEGLQQSRCTTVILDDAQHIAPNWGFACKPVCLVERLEQWRFSLASENHVHAVALHCGSEFPVNMGGSARHLFKDLQNRSFAACTLYTVLHPSWEFSVDRASG